DVAVIGIGGVGVAALQGARIAGARRIFAVDPFEWKREQALKFGATVAFADVGSAAASIAEATRGFMCHKVIVTVGHVEGKDVESWMGLTAKGGVCCLTGMASVMANEVTLNLAGLSLLQKSLQGSIFGGGNPQYDIPAILELYKLGQLNLDDMVTREYILEQINDGYRDMLEGRNVRGIIRYTDADRA
ncbi:zinc-binding dehydrogenase, partial [Mycobacterium colombiense]|uniref:zinc-binding dehydrogenase n=1 Tax=Mycobacterium colombiense TaxID=339268 RepID=UPI000A42D4CC